MNEKSLSLLYQVDCFLINRVDSILLEVDLSF